MKTWQPFPNTSCPSEGSTLNGPHLQASRDAFSLKRINCFFGWASSGSWKPRRADPVCSRTPLLLSLLFQLRRPTRLRRRNKPKISASKGLNLALLTHPAPAAHISGQQVNSGFYQWLHCSPTPDKGAISNAALSYLQGNVLESEDGPTPPNRFHHPRSLPLAPGIRAKGKCTSGVLSFSNLMKAQWLYIWKDSP